MQSIVEVVCVGGGSNNTSKQYNSVYTDPGYCKMVIVQDDDKFPSPRLCLLRRWPNFEGGFGFNLYEDLISQSGALKVEEVSVLVFSFCQTCAMSISWVLGLSIEYILNTQNSNSNTQKIFGYSLFFKFFRFFAN